MDNRQGWLKGLQTWAGAELLAVTTSALIARALLAGAIVFALLAVYQPFGTYAARIPYKLLMLSVYGWLTALALALAGAAARALRGGRPPRRWQLGAELAGALLLAGSAGYLYNALALGNPLHWSGWWYFQQLALAIGVVPAAFVLIGARERVDLRAERASAGGPPSRLTLLGENRDEKIELAPLDLLLVRAADNYSEVFHADPGGVRSRLLRGSIRAMEHQLRGTSIERVHRSCLANLARARTWRGNAQGGQIEIDGLTEPVPVARAYVARVRAALAGDIQGTPP